MLHILHIWGISYQLIRHKVMRRKTLLLFINFWKLIMCAFISHQIFLSLLFHLLSFKWRWFWYFWCNIHGIIIVQRKTTTRKVMWIEITPSSSSVDSDNVLMNVFSYNTHFVFILVPFVFWKFIIIPVNSDLLVYKFWGWLKKIQLTVLLKSRYCFPMRSQVRMQPRTFAW